MSTKAPEFPLVTEFREYFKEINKHPQPETQEFNIFSGELLSLYIELEKKVAESYRLAEKYKQHPNKQTLSVEFARKGHLAEISCIPVKALLHALRETYIVPHPKDDDIEAAKVLRRYKLVTHTVEPDGVVFSVGEGSASKVLVERILENQLLKGVFITGPAGAGKTEFIKALTSFLRRFGITVVTLQYDEIFKAFARYYPGDPLGWTNQVGKEFEKAIKDVLIITEAHVPTYLRSKFPVFFAIDMLGYPTLSLTNGLAMIQRNKEELIAGNWQLLSVVPDKRVTEFADMERVKPADLASPEDPNELYQKGAPGGVVIALYDMLLEQAKVRAEWPLLTQVDQNVLTIDYAHSLNSLDNVPAQDELRLLLGYFISTFHDAGVPLHAILPALNIYQEK